jgi:hypothetical protein
MQIWMMVPAIHRRIKSLQAKMTLHEVLWERGAASPPQFRAIEKDELPCPRRMQHDPTA